MKKYILEKMIGDRKETVEVMVGGEARRDRLIRAGYVWVNEVKPKPAPIVVDEGKNTKKADEKD